MINAVASHILGFPPVMALLLVFLLPALESSVFVGFVFPGEVALVLGGVLASQGRVPLTVVLLAGMAGAIVGDSVGYLVGHRYGHRLVGGTVGRLVPPRHLERSERYLAERGGRAVFFGRFTASLRAMIPGLAGMSRMPYGRFLLSNVAGGAIWAAFTVMLGFLGGSSWQHVAHLASRIGLVVLALFVLGFLGGWLVRRVRARAGERPLATAWVGTGRALASTRAGRWTEERFPVQLAFVGRRLDPFSPGGLPATILLLVSLTCAWTFAGLTQDVTAHEGLALIDPSAHAWALAHRSAWLDAVMKVVTWAGSNLVLIPLLVVIGLLLWRQRRSWRPALQVAVTYLAAVVAHAVMAGAVERPRPPAADWLVPATGWSYPSGHTTQVAALAGALLLVVVPRASRRTGAFVAAAACVCVLLVGASRIYLGVHWLTDVLGGLALSGAFVCAVGAVALGRSSRTDDPGPGGGRASARDTPVVAGVR